MDIIDLIIETGIAHGGSLIFSSSILQLIVKEKHWVLMRNKET